MNKLLKVSIGIPAYNEQANIKNLINNLLRQEKKGFTLNEIIVVSDASTDETLTKLYEIKSNKIKIIKNRARLGQAKSQNKILKTFQGDILVLLNADVVPCDSRFIMNIIKPFMVNKNVGLVGAKILPVMPTKFLEKVLFQSMKIKTELFESLNKGSNIYLCVGRGRAFSKEFAKKMTWPDIVTEDAFSYLECIRQGYKFSYASKAIVNYKLPSTFEDHVGQSVRFMISKDELKEYFSKDLINTQYKLPFIKKT